jgi:hypothetical protein
VNFVRSPAELSSSFSTRVASELHSLYILSSMSGQFHDPWHPQVLTLNTRIETLRVNTLIPGEVVHFVTTHIPTIPDWLEQMMNRWWTYYTNFPSDAQWDAFRLSNHGARQCALWEEYLTRFSNVRSSIHVPLFLLQGSMS